VVAVAVIVSRLSGCWELYGERSNQTGLLTQKAVEHKKL
jgi:hypothetical protein